MVQLARPPSGRVFLRPFPMTSRSASKMKAGLIWLALGAGGLLFRTVHLFFLRDVQTGLVWLTKILTDPYHDIKLYHKAPLHLLRGELFDPAPDRHQPS